MLHELHRVKSSRGIGSKADYLRLLQRHGYPVPKTFVIPWDAHEAMLAGSNEVIDTIKAEMARQLDPERAYAVRSSASVEDRACHSFAGQFTTRLHVSGTLQLLDAIQEVWRSARSDTIAAYAKTRELADAEVKMAVIVQEMVNPVASGVAFSKNPVTAMDETIVEAVLGEGTALVQEGATPARWVWKWGKWIEAPAESAAIDEDLAEAIVEGTQSIAAKLGQPVDLEWVFDGTTLYYVQARPITALPERNVYSNRISREFLPGIIKPLVWSVNVPLVNSAWIALITEMIGPNDLRPEELSKAFHYRAYFNMGAMGRIFDSLGMRRETLEVMMGLDGGDEKPSFKPSARALRHLPRMLRCMLGKLFYQRHLRRLLPELREQFREQEGKPLEELSETQLMRAISDLFALCQRVAYANIVTPLLMQIYNGIFNKRLRAAGVNPGEFDVTHGLGRMEEFDPKPSLAKLKEEFDRLAPEIQERIRAAGYEQFLEMQGIASLQQGLETFMAHFGHFSDSGNDFSRTTWREQPELVLQMLTEYMASESDVAKQSWESLQLHFLTRIRLWLFYRQARGFRFYRESIGFYYTLGYGQFRTLFLALAQRLVGRGLLEVPEDVFYLYWDEVREASVSGVEPFRTVELVRQRKEEIDAVADIVMPEIIFGEEPPPKEHELTTVPRLQGIPTSSGYYRGTVCVIRNIGDFGKMHSGAVAVIPYSDVSWTPVLVKAGSVVAESGGTLSHTSIIARECGIPAIVSVANACKRLENGMDVAVDGFKGEIVILGAE